MILFLDYDGVLHPDAAYWHPGRGVVLRTALLPPEFEHLELFCYAPALVELLDEFPDVRIILSTSWVPVLSYRKALARLPERLQRRVIGATFHSRHTPRWHHQTRYRQILESIGYRRLGMRWLALDNDDAGWPDIQRDQLVLTDDLRGIGDPAALEELAMRLRAMRENEPTP